jgi:uncharacterized protein YbaP (TraB family)
MTPPMKGFMPPCVEHAGARPRPWAGQLIRRGLASLATGLALACGAMAQEKSSAVDAPASCPPAAQLPGPAQIEAGLAHARARGFLWRLSKEGRTSYLYGTIHLGRMDWIFPGAEINAALRASDVVALEVDIADPVVSQAIRAGMARRPSELLPDVLRQRLALQLQRACLPGELLNTMAPEFLVTGLILAAGRQDGLNALYAIDPMIGSLGRAQKKPVLSLEAADLQLALLRGDAIDQKERHAALEKTLDQFEEGRLRPFLLRLTRIWAESRLDELTRYGEWCDCLNTEQDRQQMKRFIDDRNPGMADKIDAIHAGGNTVFAAVGSLHMIGPGGLPALMAERGYRVERVVFVPGDPGTE